MSEEKKMYRLTLDLSEKQLYAVQNALEQISRIGMWQFEVVVELHREELRQLGMEWEDIHRYGDTVKMVCKNLLCPTRSHHGSYGIHNDKVNQKCRMAWQVYQIMRKCTLEARGYGGEEYYTNCGIDEPKPAATLTPLPPDTKKRKPSSGPRPSGPG